MTLGPVFVIHNGSADERAKVRDSLTQQWERAFAFWTETSDSKNGNLVLVFSSNQNEAWNVRLADVYDAMNPNGASSLNVYDINAGASEDKSVIRTENPQPSMTMGFCRYP